MIRRVNNTPTPRHVLRGGSSLIQAFVDRDCIYPGETVDIFAQCPFESPAKLIIYRLGYYDGLGGAEIADPVSLTVSIQDKPATIDDAYGIADWTPCSRVETQVD
jgi:hypothetical protein